MVFFVFPSPFFPFFRCLSFSFPAVFYIVSSRASVQMGGGTIIEVEIHKRLNIMNGVPLRALGGVEGVLL